MIEVRNLTKRFGSRTAVNDLTFTVKPGVVTGFLGPNGAGKSTTMRMILGLDQPTSGQALVEGKPFAAHDDPAHVVGALLDATWAHPGRSARAHLASMAAYGNLPAKRVSECLELVGLQDVAGKKVGGFSLGMRQRLGLATAMLGDPRVLMFDEPVNGLDPEGILWVRNFMKARAAEGRTVLVSSHLLSEMAQTAEDLIVIGRGELRAQTSVSELIASQESTVIVRTPHHGEFTTVLEKAGFAVTGGPAADQLTVQTKEVARVGELAAETGVVLHELRLDQPTLEQAFMRLTSDDVEYRTEGQFGEMPQGAPMQGAPMQAVPVPGGSLQPGAPAPQGVEPPQNYGFGQEGSAK